MQAMQPFVHAAKTAILWLQSHWNIFEIVELFLRKKRLQQKSKLSQEAKDQKETGTVLKK